MLRIRRALISVWDKTGIVDLAAALGRMGAEILATGGTAKTLGAIMPVTLIERLTGFPEVLDGRVKTLHPLIFAGILARDDPKHLAQLESIHAAPIDLVVVNLYPFETKGYGAPMAEAVELIDIGGVSLLRAAAKNWQRVAVVCDPEQYPALLDELSGEGGLSDATRRRLAADAFARTAAYDAAITRYFAPGGTFPDRLILTYRKVADARYGENPHQRAAFYAGAVPRPGSLSQARHLQGKELSFNNLVDLDAAWGAVWEFDQPAAVIIKHATPCGVAEAETPVQAYAAARACDPVSAFGGVVALNREVDDQAAKAVLEIFTEAIIAPGYTSRARAAFQRKANIRVMELEAPTNTGSLEIKSVSGGLLVQDRDSSDVDELQLRTVTSRVPTSQETADLRFAWKVAKWVKSNAIVLAKGGATVGIGSGQPNRVGSVEIAAKGAGERAQGAVLASDAFFPFRDGVDAAARAGVTAIIQPGGSVRDEEVIAAAREHNIAMLFTGIRHFRH